MKTPRRETMCPEATRYQLRSYAGLHRVYLILLVSPSMTWRRKYRLSRGLFKVCLLVC
jgi:hypothetical protein